MSRLFWAGVIAVCVIGLGAFGVRALVRLVRRRQTPRSLSLHLENGHIWTTAADVEPANGVAPEGSDQPAATQAPPTVEAPPAQQAPPTPTRPLPDAEARRRVDAFIDNQVAEMVADTQRSVRADQGSVSADDNDAASAIDLTAGTTAPTRPSPKR